MNRLKELRINAGLTQLDLAKAAETTQRNISYWESGKVEINLLSAIRLAQFFQVDIEYLAGYSDEFDVKPELKRMSANVFSLEERKLVDNYRELNKSGKQLVNATIKTLLSTSAGSGENKIS